MWAENRWNASNATAFPLPVSLSPQASWCKRTWERYCGREYLTFPPVITEKCQPHYHCIRLHVVCRLACYSSLDLHLTPLFCVSFFLEVYFQLLLSQPWFGFMPRVGVNSCAGGRSTQSGFSFGSPPTLLLGQFLLLSAVPITKPWKSFGHHQRF